MAEAGQARRPLACERKWVYLLLMLTAGFYGGYTYTVRGGVFCNAQTGNLLLLAMALGRGEWAGALYYLPPLCAYLAGSMLSEAVATPIKRLGLVRWDTLLVLIEAAAVAVLGFLPETAPHQIAQVTINFLCSMQYNTFRQAQDIPMATTFCTNHVRQVGVGLVHALHHPEEPRWRRKVLSHLEMLAVFVAGCAAATALSGVFLGRTIWWALLPLGIVGGWLLYADLKGERGRLEQVPKGH